MREDREIWGRREERGEAGNERVRVISRKEELGRPRGAEGEEREEGREDEEGRR